MNTPTHLYFIRHGEAQSVHSHIIGGPQGDTGLTPLGREQATRLRARLQATGEIAADVLLASTLPRARETAEILAPVWGVPIEYDATLQEINVGEADGMSERDYFIKYGRPDFERDPFRVVAPGGENWGSFNLRIATALDRIIRAQVGKTVVLVCHGGVIEAAFPYFLQMQTLAMLPVLLPTHNTSITHWHLDARAMGSPAGGWLATTTTSIYTTPCAGPRPPVPRAPSRRQCRGWAGSDYL